MSHELRTPMNGIIGMIQLLRDSALSASQTGYVDAQETSAEALLGVLSNLLHYSKIEAGGFGLDRGEFDLRRVVEEACRMRTDTARAKGLRLGYEVGTEVPHSVTGDRACLRQILLTLLSNAIAYTASGEIEVRVVGDKSDELHFSVSDTGAGIDEERAAMLFETPSPDRGTTQRGGGFGLAISRQLIELMGGRIGAAPRPSGGSVFWFSVELPQADDGRAETPSDAAVERSVRAVASDRGPRVLLAEDNETNRLVARVLLSKLGVQMAVAHDGREAIEMAATRVSMRS